MKKKYIPISLIVGVMLTSSVYANGPANVNNLKQYENNLEKHSSAPMDIRNNVSDKKYDNVKILYNRTRPVDIKIFSKDKNITDKVKEIKVNGNLLSEELFLQAYYLQNYYMDGDKIFLPELDKSDVIEFIDYNGNTIVRAKYMGGGNFEYIEDKLKNEKPKDDLDLSNGETEDLYKNAKFSYKREMNDQYIEISNGKLGMVNFVDSVSINGRDLERKDYKIAVIKDSFYVSIYENRIYISDLKNGDIIQFKDIESNIIGTLKYRNGELERIDDNSKLDNFFIKIEGYFEPALVGQQKYDAISGATGMINENKNSHVSVVTNRGDVNRISDWKTLSEDLPVPANEIKVSISPEGSGMVGKIDTYTSELKLSGVPKREGTYKIKITVPFGGKIIESNELKFRIFNNDVKFNDRLNDAKVNFEFKKLKEDNKYFWDIEPWEIKNFGGTDESVTIPRELKLMWGSHVSGTYSYLGKTKTETDGQTIIIDSDTDFTLINTIVRSGVNIIVKGGGKFNLYDSVVYGNIIVLNGGTFQMNHDTFNNKPITGSSINGQLILEDGAILKDSLIYSNTNFVAEKLNAPANKNDDAVVLVKGNIKIDGKVFVRGDEEATGTKPDGTPYRGQSAMRIENGVVTLAEGSILGLYGGGKASNAANHFGGNALELVNGKIDGEGRLIAIGGSSHSKNGFGGKAVYGIGDIDVKEAYLEGGDNYSGGRVGKFSDEKIIISPKVKGEAKDGIQKSSNDNLVKENYWSDVKIEDSTRALIESPFSSQNKKDEYIIKSKGSENSVETSENKDDEEKPNIERPEDKNKGNKKIEDKQDNKEQENKPDGEKSKNISKDKKNKNLDKNEKRKSSNNLSISNSKAKKNSKINSAQKIENRKTGVSKTPYLVGYPDGTLRPDGKVTRAEAVTMIAKLKNYDLQDIGTTKYKDADGWFNGSINACYKAGILEEKEGENFRPNDMMTRGELAYIISQIDKFNEGASPFTDISGHKYEKEINILYINKRISGYPDGSFKPDKEITRAEIVKILNNIFEIKLEDKSEEEFLQKFSDLDKKHWAFYELIKAAM